MRKKLFLSLILILMSSMAVSVPWHTSSQQVELNPSDDESGVNNTYYCVDQSDSCEPRTDGQKYDGNFTVSSEGINYVRFNTKDNVGNVEPTQSRKIKIDKTDPETSANYTGGWTNTSVTVNITCNDPENPEASGCDTTEFCVDQINSCTPSRSDYPVTFTDEGVHFLRYRSEDVAGNTEDINSTAVKLDFTGPEILVNKEGNEGSGSVNATVFCNDNRSGCQASSLRLHKSESPLVQCPTDKGEYNETTPYSVEQHLWICGAGRDKAGNWDISAQPLEFSVGTLTAVLQYPGKPGLIYTSLDSRVPITVKVSNEEDMTRVINVSAEGVPVEFENEKSFREVELNGVEDARISGVVKVESQGNQTLTVNIQDETEGFTITREADIFARKSGARTSSTGKSVPGIGLVQVAALLIIASTYFIARRR